MIILNIDFKCKMPECGNSTEWYAMPIKKKVNNDFISSLTEYEIQCKKCKKSYILKFSIDMV